MSTDNNDRDAVIEAYTNASLIAEGKAALQRIEDREKARGTGGGGRGAATSDLDDSPGAPE